MLANSGKRQVWGCAILAALVTIAAITLTPIGPIGVYGWLVPIISPIIPKPDDVPSRAKAEYHWKGFGLVWVWEYRVAGGCAEWWAADGVDGPVRGLTVFEGEENCTGGARAMYRLSFLDHTTFGDGENEWPYEKCPFDLSEASIDRLLTQVEELKTTSSGEIQTNMLVETRTEIEQIGLLGLRAEQYGCRVDRQ